MNLFKKLSKKEGESGAPEDPDLEVEREKLADARRRINAVKARAVMRGRIKPV